MEKMQEAVVGIIGMGDMGKMYARRISDAGWSVHACDVPEKYEALKAEFAESVRNIVVLCSSHLDLC
ncbi:hypothetical protein BDY17DRAFT_289138 [Neohortaea acidophila]|uniref:6-phosphogluconate dehydrogenase NADP-binding domain-containing protein n=1 Tax=Neohortaea acidophila TaxID=245834 RepID=A0A6A6Q5D5_9PEZI|nr:uncharacterized protein BDY17DRAFT_289138 [Neohortaea acidophila]KAF2487525.1 hypothetical protein BDY17DRAFT_289138 [Neohortaea acidophila]